jgi:hypothetical protein
VAVNWHVAVVPEVLHRSGFMGSALHCKGDAHGMSSSKMAFSVDVAPGYPLEMGGRTAHACCMQKGDGLVRMATTRTQTTVLG